MSTKKPTPAQLAARKKFAAMAKSGELAKKRKAAPNKITVSKAKSFANTYLMSSYKDLSKAIEEIKKDIAKYVNSPGAKTSEAVKKRISDMKGALKILQKKQGLKKPQTKGLVTLCSMSVGTIGRRKKDGTLKKGYIATKGGKVVLKKKVVKKK